MFNVILSIIMLILCNYCEYSDTCDFNQSKLGFDDLADLHFTVKLIIFLFYFLISLAYTWVLIRIRKYFIQAYKIIYQ